MVGVQQQVITEAYNQGFWIGTTAVLVVSCLGFLVYLAKYYQKQLEELRDRYERQQREDLMLFAEVRNTLQDQRGPEVQRLLDIVSAKIDQLLILAQKG